MSINNVDIALAYYTRTLLTSKLSLFALLFPLLVVTTIIPAAAPKARPKMVKLKNCVVMPEHEVQSTILRIMRSFKNPEVLRELFKKAENPDYKLPKAAIAPAQQSELLQLNGMMHPYISSVLVSGGKLEGNLFVFNNADMYGAW